MSRMNGFRRYSGRRHRREVCCHASAAGKLDTPAGPVNCWRPIRGGGRVPRAVRVGFPFPRARAAALQQGAHAWRLRPTTRAPVRARILAGGHVPTSAGLQTTRCRFGRMARLSWPCARGVLGALGVTRGRSLSTSLLPLQKPFVRRAYVDAGLCASHLLFGYKSVPYFISTGRTPPTSRIASASPQPLHRVLI